MTGGGRLDHDDVEIGLLEHLVVILEEADVRKHALKRRLFAGVVFVRLMEFRRVRVADRDRDHPLDALGDPLQHAAPAPAEPDAAKSEFPHFRFLRNKVLY